MWTGSWLAYGEILRNSADSAAVFEQSNNAPRRGEDRDYGQRRYDRDYEPRPYREYGPRRYDDDGE